MAVFLEKDYDQVKLHRHGQPYLKKLFRRSNITVWIVDGNWIRKKLCEDFVNCGQHYHFKFIPLDEFWIAKERIPGEERYYFDYLRAEHHLMHKGLSYRVAYHKAKEIENSERSKSALMKKFRCFKKKELLPKIHRALLNRLSTKIKIWIVNGELVRDLYGADFAGGGHDHAYHFIPKNEVWIDNDLSPKERLFVILHELHERRLMAKGANYERAHHCATEIEDRYRHHERGLLTVLKAELRKQ